MEQYINLFSQHGSLPILFALSFLGGLIASLSPCSLAMLPLIVGYVGGYSDAKPLKTFIQMLFFVFGTAIVFSIIGIICAITGKVFISFAGGYFGTASDYTSRVNDNYTIKRPLILRCPANPPGGWVDEPNFADYLYTRDSSDVFCQVPSFNKTFSRLKGEVLTYCVTGEALLRNGVEIGRPQPLHNGGITVSRANGACTRVDLNAYRGGDSLEKRLTLIDEMN